MTEAIDQCLHFMPLGYQQLVWFGWICYCIILWMYNVWINCGICCGLITSLLFDFNVSNRILATYMVEWNDVSKFCMPCATWRRCSTSTSGKCCKSFKLSTKSPLISLLLTHISIAQQILNSISCKWDTELDESVLYIRSTTISIHINTHYIL